LWRLCQGRKRWRSQKCNGRRDALGQKVSSILIHRSTSR
jgi:hypothetical protein